MIWKAVWTYVVLTAIFGKRHPNFRFPSWLRMDALRIYWFMRDRGMERKARQGLHAEHRVGMKGCTFR